MKRFAYILLALALAFLGPARFIMPASAAAPAVTYKFAYTWRGTWDAATRYAKDDLAYYDGSTYKAKLANLAQTPASNTTYWEVFASKGGTFSLSGLGVYNLVDYGGRNSGNESDRTTNTTAFAAALAAAKASGGTLYIPPGIYYVNPGTVLSVGSYPFLISGYGAIFKLPSSTALTTGSLWGSGSTYAASALTYRNSSGDLYTLTTAGAGAATVQPTHTIATATDWASGQTVTVNYFRYNGARTYQCTTAGGGTTSVAPTHASGAVTGADGYEWTVGADGYSWRVSSLNTSRIITSNTTTPTWSSTSDSPVVTIAGLTLDGNRSNRGTYSAFEQEQSHAIYLSAGNQSAQGTANTVAGRLRVNLQDVVVQETTGDGLSLNKNVDVVSVNLRAYNCWRGGFVATGGWSRFHLTNTVIDGSSDFKGVDIEIDGKGYDDSAGSPYRIEGAVDGLYDAAALSIGFNSSGLTNHQSSFYGNNIKSKKANFAVNGYGGKIRLANCDITTGVFDASAGRLIWPWDFEASNCIFRSDDQTTSTDHSCINIIWRISPTFPTGLRAAFRGCRFIANDSVTATNRYGIYSGGDDRASGNRLIVDGCQFQGSSTRSFTEGVRVNQGGNPDISNCRMDYCTTAVSLRGTSTLLFDGAIDDVRATNGTTWLALTGDGSSTNTLTFRSVRDLAANLVYSKTSGAGDLTYGTRDQAVAATPTGGGLKGDVATLAPVPTSGTLSWLCTVSHVSAATWVPLQVLPVGPADATITVDAEGTAGADTHIVTVQLKDANAVNLAVRGGLQAFLSDDANGDSLVATAPSGAVVISTNGWLHDAAGTKKAFRVTSEANGLIDLSIAEAGAKTLYLGLVMPNGTLKMSGAVTFAP